MSHGVIGVIGVMSYELASLSVIWEPFGGHLGAIWESFGNHLGAIWEAFGRLEPEQASGRHLEVRSQKLQPLSAKMQKFH